MYNLVVYAGSVTDGWQWNGKVNAASSEKCTAAQILERKKRSGMTLKWM